MTLFRAFMVASMLSIVCIQQTIWTKALAQPTSEDVEVLTYKIIKVQSDLERYSLNYRLVSTHESKFKALRYFAGQQTAAALQMVSGIVNVQEFSGHQIPRDRSLKQASECNLTGLIIGGSSSAFELAANGSKSLYDLYKKQDSNTAKKFVFAKLHEMDGLFSRLDSACESMPDGAERQIHIAESKLLKHSRDLCLYEFVTWYADIRSDRIGSNVFYLLNIASNAVGAVSTGYGLRTFKRPPAAGPANVAALIADSIAIPSAPIGAFTTSRLYKYWFNKLYREMGAIQYDVTTKMEDEFTRYKQLLHAQAPDTLQGNFEKRVKMYDRWNTGYLDYDLKNRRHLRHLQEVAVESSLDGPLLGGTALAQDTCSTVGYFRYRDNPRRSRTLNMTSGILQTTGNASALTLSTINMACALQYQWKVGRKGELPDQIIHKRLKMAADADRMDIGAPSNSF